MSPAFAELAAKYLALHPTWFHLTEFAKMALFRAKAGRMI